MNERSIRNTGSGDQDNEIRRTREEFSEIDMTLQGAYRRHDERVKASKAQAGEEIREAIKAYAQSVRGELSQAAYIRWPGFDLDIDNWTIQFHGANRAIDGNAPFLNEEVWFDQAGAIIYAIGEALMSLRAHTNAPLRQSEGR